MSLHRGGEWIDLQVKLNGASRGTPASELRKLPRAKWAISITDKMLTVHKLSLFCSWFLKKKKKKKASAENQTRASRSLHVLRFTEFLSSPAFTPSLIFYLRAECLCSIGPFWRSTPTHTHSNTLSSLGNRIHATTELTESKMVRGSESHGPTLPTLVCLSGKSRGLNVDPTHEIPARTVSF